MIDRRTKNAEIFLDTKKHYETDETLKNAIRNSKAKQRFRRDDEVIINFIPIEDAEKYNKEKDTKVIVSSKRSLEAAEVYAKQGKKVCVLNFASATNPGGGVIHGASAQEECICRCSTLYPCLNEKYMWNVFYGPHRNANNPLYNDDCIYTPGVCVFKSDTNFPEMLPKDEWWYTDIITCAAPNLRKKPSNNMNPFAGSDMAEITETELEKLLTTRIERIFRLAYTEKNDVLILGAFGCGAFKNPPEIVARVFNKVMKNYIGKFDVIEYAVYHTERETHNYTAFCNEMNK